MRGGRGETGVEGKEGWGRRNEGIEGSRENKTEKEKRSSTIYRVCFMRANFRKKRLSFGLKFVLHVHVSATPITPRPEFHLDKCSLSREQKERKFGLTKQTDYTVFTVGGYVHVRTTL